VKWGVAAVCVYEAASIATGKTPTVTMLCARRRWLAPAVLAVLAVHLYRKPPIVTPSPDIPGDLLA
jgi:hypothetical protein